MTSGRRLLIGTAWLLLPTSPLDAQSPAQPLAQDQAAAELDWLVNGLTVTPRVLVIGMHPDDEDSQLIAWLSRGRNIETAYLSITRGEAGRNFGGGESGSSLGAIRTQEALAARRIDGAKQFFTRAYDFGFARDTVDVLKHWARDSIVGDMVAVIRSFRPHVIIAVLSDSVAGDDGQHRALGLFVDYAVIAAAAVRFAPETFGAPWPVPKLYRYGTGLHIETAGYDRVLGKTYAELSLESRTQQRSQGLNGAPLARPTVIELHRLGARVAASFATDQSLLGGIDTTFARLATNAVPALAAAVSAIAALADSARHALDLRNPAAAVPYLAQVARLATNARAISPWCQHPSPTAAPPIVSTASCNPRALDLDASIDLVRERSVAALLAAAGVSFEAAADRELVATDDTAEVTVSVLNHGTMPVTLSDVSVWGALPATMEPIVVRPDSAARVVRRVTGLVDPRPWWIGPRGGERRGGDRFEAVSSSIDGLMRSDVIPAPLRVLGVAVPENIRRTSDATVTVTIADATVTTSLGPVIYRHADAEVGLQNRPLAGVPNVTLQFARSLDWIPRNKPLLRTLRIAIKSHSDHEQDVALGVVVPNGIPKGLRVDSVPASLRLDPHEERQLFITLRGKLEATDRHAIGLGGVPLVAARDSATTDGHEVYQVGFQVVQRDYLPPIRLFPSSGEWIQPVDISVPPNLTALYVPGGRDEIASALAQVGVRTTEVTTADQLLAVDLSRVTTVAIGPRAFESKPELLGQAGRLLEFVRAGGTLVILRADSATASSGLFPYAMAFERTVGERVTQPDAPMKVLDPNARVLNWPNKIGAGDWSKWVGERAEGMPSVADPRYGKIVETHDPGQPENRNAILVARMGKGMIVYTALTIDQQVAGGIPGGLRLLVNLLSAGLQAPR